MLKRIRPLRLSRLEAICLAASIIFLLVIFLPPVYVLSYAFKGGITLDAQGQTALTNSLIIGLAVTLADIILGLPVAWVMARRKNLPMRHFIDTLIDMPLVVPTSVLGLSIFYFWGGGIGSLFGLDGGLVGKGPLLIALLHVVFTFPYIVRSIEAAIQQIDMTHEQAATMLGASSLTAFRTISLPLFKKGLISGMILVFTRSLSETGATMMVAGAYLTAPTIVVAYKQASDIHSAAAVSVILIAVAVALLLATRAFSGALRVPIGHVWPRAERALSRRYVGLRDAIIGAAVVASILLPTFYIVLTGANTVNLNAFASLASDSVMMDAIIVSFVVGFVVTAANLVLAVPMAIFINKNMFKLGSLADTMGDIILLVPTSALGLSLGLFWKNFAFGEYLILILAHLSFTFPLMLKPIVASLSGVDTRLEDAARTLGARQSTMYRTIVYPLVRPAIIAGVIMTFMRSLSETGATLAVSDKIKTIPVVLVDAFTKGQVKDDTILACIILFAISFAFIIVLKLTDRGENAVR